MKKVVFAFVLIITAVGIFSFTSKFGDGDVYKVNTAKSKVDFIGSKTEGYHSGAFSLKSGELTVENGKIIAGKFSIDLNSLKISDSAGERLETHLKSPDFFDFSKSTEANYYISNVKYISDTKAEVDGILTLNRITSPVKFVANIRGIDDKKLFAEAAFVLDRSAFGMGYGKGLIANDVQIYVHLFANK